MSTKLPERIKLGKTDLEISLIGLGTWSWGDRLTWRYGKAYTADDIGEVFEASIKNGVNFIDTAEVYGLRKSETILGELLPRPAENIVIATKFFAFPWRLTQESLLRTLRGSLRRMRLDQVDLYMIHWPIPPVPIKTWMKAMAKAVNQGLSKAVGVSNYNLAQMREAQRQLAMQNLPLASNQVRYNLLHRNPEDNGVLDFCQRENITLIAYSPLEQGLLTGKYSSENPPPFGFGRVRRISLLNRLPKLIHLMREIGEGHGGKTPAQVAINWAHCKGAVPIPGANNVKQAVENLGSVGWRLSADEIAILEQTSDHVIKGD